LRAVFKFGARFSRLSLCMLTPRVTPCWPAISSSVPGQSGPEPSPSKGPRFATISADQFSPFVSPALHPLKGRPQARFRQMKCHSQSRPCTIYRAVPGSFWMPSQEGQRQGRPQSSLGDTGCTNAIHHVKGLYSGRFRTSPPKKDARDDQVTVRYGATTSLELVMGGSGDAGGRQTTAGRAGGGVRSKRIEWHAACPR
jgi:hypothetical protein